ncbi:MAG: LptF/LptG family permease [Planctomycetota bacterium]
MRLLDRSIALQFAMNVFVLLIILGSFVVAVDASLNLDNYSKAAGRDGGFIGRAIGTLGVVWSLWWPRLLQLFNVTLGFVLVAALGFTCAQLVVRREFVAMLSSGISLRRAMAPVAAVSAGFFAVAIANQEFVIPRIAPALVADGLSGVGSSGGLGVTQVPTTPDARGRLYYAREFDPDEGVLRNLQVWERDERGVPVAMIAAREAAWDGTAWVLTDGRMQPVGRPGAATPIERLETELDPAAMAVRRFSGLGQNLGFFELGEMLDQEGALTPDLRRRLQRDRWGRVGSWLATALSLVLAVPFLVTREPRNMAIQAAKCAPLVLAALVLSVLGVYAPVAGVPAWLSVFLPALVLAPAAAAAASSIQT